MTCIKQKFVFRKKCISPFCYVLVQQSFRVSVLSFCLFGQPVPIHLPCSPFLFTQTVAEWLPKKTLWPVHCQCSNHQRQSQAPGNADCLQGRVHIMALGIWLKLRSCGRLTFFEYWVIMAWWQSLFIKSKLWPDTTVTLHYRKFWLALVIQPELQTPHAAARGSLMLLISCACICEDGELRMTQLFTQQHPGEP